MKRKSRRRLKGPIHGRILALREKQGLTQEELAKILGVDPTAISHWENRIARPDQDRLAAVASALGTTIEKLLKAA